MMPCVEQCGGKIWKQCIGVPLENHDNARKDLNLGLIKLDLLNKSKFTNLGLIFHMLHFPYC
jgi:hypothetical protein